MAKKKRVAAQAETVSVVSFVLGVEQCALRITDVHQVIRDTPITRVPNVNPHVEGVINLRGQVVPVVDLKNLLGLGVRTMGEQHRLLIVEQGGRKVGFSVDSIKGVLQLDAARIQPAPEVLLAKVAGRYVRGVVQQGDTIVVLLDLPELLASQPGTRRARHWGQADRAIAHAAAALDAGEDHGNGPPGGFLKP